MQIILKRCTAVAALVAGCALFTTANAVVITTLNDGTWDVSALPRASFSADQALLEDQFWWGNSALAQEVANLVVDGLGLPNGGGSPYYAFETVPNNRITAWSYFPQFGVPILSNVPQTNQGTYAVAERITVPTPATIALFGLGLAGIGYKRKERSGFFRPHGRKRTGCFGRSSGTDPLLSHLRGPQG